MKLNLPTPDLPRFLAIASTAAVGLVASLISASADDEVLLNGTNSTGVFGYTNFLDETELGSRAWSFREDGAILDPIATSGALATVTPESVPLAGNSDVTFGPGTLFAGLGGFAWTGLVDQIARDAMSNGSGFHSLSTITIAPTAALSGTTYHVELLAFAAFAADRRFNVTANGLPRVTDWTILAGDPFCRVLEFDVIADDNGILLEIGIGSEGDTNPYLGAMAITPVDGDIGDTDGDGQLDFLEQRIIDAAAAEEPPVNLTLDDVKGPNDLPEISDYDQDGVSDHIELSGRTDPIDPDTDDDGLLDGVETATGLWVNTTNTGTDPTNPDTDRDGLADSIENPDVASGTDPNNRDTDGDGISDSAELAAGTNPADPADRPASVVVSRWRFDGNISDTAINGTNADDLTDLTEGISFVPGVVGNAVAITNTPGATNKLSAPDSADLNLVGDWTIEAFVWRDTNNSTGVEWERFWCKWEGNQEYHWSFRGTDGELIPDGLDLFANNVPVFDHDTTSTGLPFETWVHVALVGDRSGSNTIRGYIDGVEVVSTPYVVFTPTAANMTFGNFAAGDQSTLQFSGLIDEAQIHQGAVNSSYLQTRVDLLRDAPQRIVRIDFEQGSDTATITWTSVLGRDYALDWSNDLTTWFEVDDSIPGMEGQTSYDDESVPADAKRRYYRVREFR